MGNDPIKLVKNFKSQEGIGEFEHFVNSLKESVEDIALRLNPEEDWAPVFFLLNDKGEMYQVMASFENDEEKDFYGRLLIPSLILKYNISIYGFVSTAWMAKEKSATHRSEVLPVDHPDRVEIIILEARSFDKSKSMIASIKRQKKKHPTLESWKEFNGTTQGRFVDTVMKALLHNKSIGRRMN
jgi:hypothetical protein